MSGNLPITSLFELSAIFSKTHSLKMLEKSRLISSEDFQRLNKVFRKKRYYVHFRIADGEKYFFLFLLTLKYDTVEKILN